MSPFATPTRRTVVARLAVAAPLAGAAIATAALAADPDPHPAWMAEADRLRDWINDPPDDDVTDDEQTPAFEEMCRLHDLVCATPARTARGAAAQVRYVVDHYDRGCCLPGETEFEGLRNALATLDRLAAEGRA